MIFGNPVRGRIYLSPGLVNGSARWFRSQRFGCTGFSWERPLGNCAHYHRGVDIARGPAGCNDDLLSMRAGTVVYTGTLNDGAKSVIVYHGNGVATGHVHMASISVSQGQKVSKGQRLGTIGATGLATGCHDHAALKTGFDGSLRGAAAANAFWNDGHGTWRDVWPQLEQNVKVRVDTDEGIRVRTSPNLEASSIYAVVRGGRLVRASDGADLGAASAWRAWGGNVTGASFGGSTTWRKILLGGTYRVVHSQLSDLSAT